MAIAFIARPEWTPWNVLIAAVAAGELHRHEAGGEGAQPGEAVAGVGAARRRGARASPGSSGERELRLLPVAVDDRPDLLVAEARTCSRTARSSSVSSRSVR